MTKLSGRTGLALAGVGVALLLTGCGNAPSSASHVTADSSHRPAGQSSTGTSAGGSSSGSSGGSNSSASAGQADGQTGGQSGAQTGAASASPGPAQCMAAGLDAAVRQGDSAAGSSYYTLVLTNTGDQPCSTGGFGGVSLVGHGDGSQIGAPATRDDQAKAHTLVLQPGDKAAATLQVASVDNFSRAECRPTPADGLRIYPPNNTASLFAKAADLTGCANPKVQLLTLSPYRLVK